MLDRKKAEFTIEMSPETDVAPEEHFATGDDEEDARLAKQVREDAEWNEWAWCVVRVVCSYPGLPFEGDDYLGCCSYKDQKEFEQDAYFGDMCDVAWKDLVAQAEKVRDVLCG